MSATLQAINLSAGHGGRVLFDGLDLVVAPGDVIGLVGANGAGKTTLLRLLAGEDAPLDGRISVSPPTATIGHLHQEPERREGETIAAFIARRTGVSAALEAMDRAAVALAEGTPDADDVYAAALERWLALGGADLEQRIGSVAADVGLALDTPADLDRPMTALSGGQAARVGLAALLLSRYDVLLLDEPTNDLDLDGLALLEKFVQGLRSPAVIVSHDREFLARTVSGIVELDLAQHSIGIYEGGYDAYLHERDVARRHARAEFEEYDDKLGSLKDRAQMQRNWMAQGVRNARRKAPDNDKIGKAHRLESSEKQAAKARQTQRMIERLDVVEEPRKEWQLQMTIGAAPRSGSVVATANAAVVRRGAFTLGPVDAQVDFADRIVITGSNGSGKTTLIGALLGRIPVDAGSVSLGSGVRIGEIDQARGLFLGDQPLARAFGDAVPDWPDAEVRTLLAKFGLTRDHVLRPAGSLSPGERTRAALALLQATEVNLLVLDEPTNHLDLPAIEQLEQAIDSFDGTLLLVTHDRRMSAEVRGTRRWHLDAGRLTESR
ncbi:ABC-F family ATP-binding cassette domain-containing protein [Nakamurella sp. A5-74]|uniref:ABC-F family ATP-binding cassette domain-containing protein n=1 Tax=Nakamurella sp. A5-74 TaxID=3158264 RepID=A0AAU8DSD9_9ACTN